MKILITGANGFIGNHLVSRLLRETDHSIVALDLTDDKLNKAKDYVKENDCQDRLALKLCDFTKIRESSLESMIIEADLVMHLIAIANPGIYIKDPLHVFQLDFLENLKVIDYCSKHGKRIIQFSTSEVYGKNAEQPFNEDTTDLVLGPIKQKRWIYSCSKQLLDRVVMASGEKHDLKWSAVRPFNFIGPKIDYLPSEKEGNPRVICHFMEALMTGNPLQLVDGGSQKRCFVYIRDAIDCLLKIIENTGNVCDSEVFNIGNPDAELSIKELAEMMRHFYEKNHLKEDQKLSDIEVVSSEEFYGEGYEDTSRRVPDISKAWDLLGWKPKVSIEEMIERTVNYYVEDYVDYYRS